MPASPPSPRAGLAAALLLGLAVLVYAWGLGGQNIPRNGDEMVYAHIARLTAQSGHWLPLMSDLDHMRNTKPPLLFWQALLASDWGQRWTLLALRLPSLVYTLMTALLCGVAVWQITRQRTQALLAGAIYLAFLSSFRFGRPYLTSAPETFWLSLPLWWLLWRCRQPLRLPGLPGWPTTVLLGLALGLGAAYKSFALIVPACAAFWVAVLVLERPRSLGRWLGISVRVASMGVVALALFGLWFVLDPDPAAVWQEFVVGENAGKLGRDTGYWRAALQGSSSIWVQATAYLQNAGLLALPVLGLTGRGLTTLWPWRRAMPSTVPAPEGVWVAAAWLLVWLLIFCLPSTRSARYVIPAMPALAVLLALYWPRLGRAWFVATLVLALPPLLLLARIAWVMAGLGILAGLDLGVAALAFGAAAGCVLIGIYSSRASRPAALGVCLCVFACFNATVAGLDTAGGRFETAAARQLRGARLAVPSGFNGQFERYAFLLPGNLLHPYAAPPPAAAAAALPDLLAHHDALVWSQPVDAPAPCPPAACVVLDVRWDIQGRHQEGDIGLGNLWYPQRWLLRREWLLRPL